MPEKLQNWSDPACRTHDGVDRIRWVESDGGTIWPRRGGKGVSLAARYRHADANSSTLAGWLEMDAVGVTGGHPASVSSGDRIPVNFGLDKTCVYPTSNRKAVEADVGRQFDIVLDANSAQYVNMNATGIGVLTLTDVLDDGDFAVVEVTAGMRYGNI